MDNWYDTAESGSVITYVNWNDMSGSIMHMADASLWNVFKTSDIYLGNYESEAKGLWLRGAGGATQDIFTRYRANNVNRGFDTGYDADSSSYEIKSLNNEATAYTRFAINRSNNQILFGREGAGTTFLTLDYDINDTIIQAADDMRLTIGNTDSLFINDDSEGTILTINHASDVTYIKGKGHDDTLALYAGITGRPWILLHGQTTDGVGGIELDSFGDIIFKESDVNMFTFQYDGTFSYLKGQNATTRSTKIFANSVDAQPYMILSGSSDIILDYAANHGLKLKEQGNTKFIFSGSMINIDPSTTEPNKNAGTIWMSSNAADTEAKLYLMSSASGEWINLILTAGGTDTQVQYNDDGKLGGDSAFVYNAGSNVLTVPAISGSSIDLKFKGTKFTYYNGSTLYGTIDLLNDRFEISTPSAYGIRLNAGDNYDGVEFGSAQDPYFMISGMGVNSYLRGGNAPGGTVTIRATSVDATPYIKLTGGGNIELHSKVDYVSSQIFSGGAFYTTTAAPTLDRQLANKKYVDDEIGAGVPSAPGGSLTDNIGSDYTYGISGVAFVSSQKFSGGTYHRLPLTADYIVDKDGANYFAINGHNGSVVTYGTSAGDVINYTLSSCGWDNTQYVGKWLGSGSIYLNTDILLDKTISGAWNTTLDLGGHTIWPTAEFNVIKMIGGFTVQNGQIDWRRIGDALTDNDTAQLWFMGSSNTWMSVDYMPCARNLKLIGATNWNDGSIPGVASSWNSGTAILFETYISGTYEEILSTDLSNIWMKQFEYGVKAHVSGMAINNVRGDRLHFAGNSYNIYLSGNKTLGDWDYNDIEQWVLKNCLFQTHGGTVRHIYLGPEADANIIEGAVWDLTTPGAATILFEAHKSSQNNSIKLNSTTAFTTHCTDNGTDNRWSAMFESYIREADGIRVSGATGLATFKDNQIVLANNMKFDNQTDTEGWIYGGDNTNDELFLVANEVVTNTYIKLDKDGDVKVGFDTGDNVTFWEAGEEKASIDAGGLQVTNGAVSSAAISANTITNPNWTTLTGGGSADGLHTHTGAASAPGGSMTANVGSDYTFGISGLAFLSSQTISGGTYIGGLHYPADIVFYRTLQGITPRTYYAKDARDGTIQSDTNCARLFNSICNSNTKIFVASGEYIVTDTIYPKESCYIQGAGVESTRFNMSDCVKDVFHFSGVSHCTLRDLEINKDWAVHPNSGAMIKISALPNSTTDGGVRNNSFSNLLLDGGGTYTSGNSIHLYASGSTTAQSISLCNFTNIYARRGWRGIWLQNRTENDSAGAYMNSNYFTNIFIITHRVAVEYDSKKSDGGIPGLFGGCGKIGHQRFKNLDIQGNEDRGQIGVKEVTGMCNSFDSCICWDFSKWKNSGTGYTWGIHPSAQNTYVNIQNTIPTDGTDTKNGASWDSGQRTWGFWGFGNTGKNRLLTSKVLACEYISSATGIYANFISANNTNIPGASPDAEDTFIQFNDGGDFGGEAEFTYDKNSYTVTIQGALSSQTISGGTIKSYTFSGTHGGGIYAHFVSANNSNLSTGGGGASDLSDLTIDAHKDWNNKGISNLHYISSLAVSSGKYVNLPVAADYVMERVGDNYFSKNIKSGFISSSTDFVKLSNYTTEQLIGKGGHIYVKPGNYYTSGVIWLYEGTTWEGGGNATRFQFDINTFYHSSSEFDTSGGNIVLKNFMGYGPGRIRLIGPSTQTTRNIHLENIYMSSISLDDDQWSRGTIVLYPKWGVLENVHIDNCYVYSSTNHGFCLNAEWPWGAGDALKSINRDVYFNNCVAENIGMGYTGYPNNYPTGFDIIEHGSSENVWIVNCKAKDIWESGFHMEVSNTTHADKNINFINCVAENCANVKHFNYINDENQMYNHSGAVSFGVGYHIHSGTTAINCKAINCAVNGFRVSRGGRIIDCEVDGRDLSKYGIYGAGTTGSDGELTIRGNTIKNIKLAGIYIYNYSGAVVDGNILKNVGNSGTSSAHYGIRLGSKTDGSSITNNKIRMSMSGTTASEAIRIDNNSLAKGNTIYKSPGVGIYLFDSESQIIGNQIVSSSTFGIRTGNNKEKFIISENTIKSVNRGIQLRCWDSIVTNNIIIDTPTNSIQESSIAGNNLIQGNFLSGTTVSLQANKGSMAKDNKGYSDNMLFATKPNSALQYPGEIIRVSGSGTDKTYVYMSVRNDAGSYEWIQLAVST